MFVTAGHDLKFHDGITTSIYTYVPCQNGHITSVSWSNDNELLLILTENSLPEVLSLKDPKHIKPKAISSVFDVKSATFQHSSKCITGLGTTAGQVLLFDVKNQSIHKLFQNVPSAVNLLDFNCTDAHMAVSAITGTIYVYDLEDISAREVLTMPKSCCATSMRFHPANETLLLLGVEDGLVTHWDLQANAATLMSQMHTAPVSGLALIDDWNTFVSVSYDHKFCVYDQTSGICTFRSYLQYPLTSVDASNGTIAIGSLYGNLYVYDVRNLVVPLLSETPHKTKINKIAFESKCQNPNEENSVVKELKEDQRLEAVRQLKQEVADCVRVNAEELQSNVVKQMASLGDFILNEVQVMCKEVEDKWDFRSFGQKLDEVLDV